MSVRGASIAPRATLAPSPVATGAASSPESRSPSGPVTSIVTSREWVLPPRPKPGRKPSVDTPVSKRKAQNRAAQRAFRERRATRVQELEQQLLEVEKENEIKEMGLVNTINKLKFENQILSKSVEQLRLEFNAFRKSTGASTVPASTISPQSFTDQYPNNPQHSALNNYNTASTAAMAESASNAYKADLNQTAQQLLNFAKSLPANHPSVSPALLQYSVQQILPAPSADSPGSFVGRQKNQRKSSVGTDVSLQSHNPHSTEDFDCGVCDKEECVCEDIGLKSKKKIEDTFNSFSPMPAVSLRGKRKKNSNDIEVDFTTEFAVKKMPDLKRLRKSSRDEAPANPASFNESSPVENCGFCSDDTPCVCREAAKEAARIKDLSQKQEQGLEDTKNEHADEAGPTLLPPIQVRHPSIMRKTSLPVMHPGPTFELRDISNMTPSNVPSVSQDQPESLQKRGLAVQEDGDNSGCTGNPGTCSQCQTDPMSTLFCSTVASKAAQEHPLGERRVSTPTTKADYFSSPHASLNEGRNNSVSLSTNPSTPQVSTPSGSTTGIFIPCADAYRTLSRHKRFNAVDFSSLVGRLTTRGMQVEVQSVANVLRELDKKVYD